MAISREAEPVSEAVERVFNVLLLILEAPLSSAPAARQAQVWPKTKRCISLRLWLPTWIAVFNSQVPADVAATTGSSAASDTRVAFQTVTDSIGTTLGKGAYGQ
jgi:hypothetical protein